eukprot:Phypoly_transcript_02519.p1 GENE.Phypoly_transcript_02519~~Phypoly_transcript_02519.p1  ORF type:complete len:681 (+),score=138.27 Phypoly_transcript_02519:633-2675(+)
MTTQQMKKKIVRCIELKLNGKSIPIFIDHAGFVVNQERITSIEEECGEALPADYREFLVAYNGARLLSLDSEAPKPILSHLSNIVEVSDFGLLGTLLEGINYEKNSLVLIGTNHDGSVYTLMNTHGKKKGEIYHYNTREISADLFKQPAYKSFTELLQAISKSEYAKQVAKSGVVKSMSPKPGSPIRDDDVEPKIQIMPINSKKFPVLSEVVNNLFERVETEENEYGRVLVKNKPDKRKIILLMTYVRDILHEQADNDIQSYLDFFSPFKMYLISESDLEELMGEGLIDENDEITKKGIEETEKIISEESEKIAPIVPKKESSSSRPSTYKGCVDVVLSGKTTPLQLTQIGTLINESRIKKLEKDLGNITLPKEYREFLLAYNGGTAKQMNLIIDGNIETAGIKIFRDVQTLEEIGGSQNTEWLAIGTDKFEHLVYISLKGEKKGFLYRYKQEDGEDEVSNKFPESFTDVPKQLLAKSFLEFALNAVQDAAEDEEAKDERINEEYLEVVLPDEIRTKFPQLTGVMWAVYENAEKHESKYGRITLPNKQDVQNVILLVKFITYYNSESFVTVTNHTPFKFCTILDTHIDDLRKAKLLSGNSKLTKKGREEVEKLIMETKVVETKSDSEVESKKGKEKKKESKATAKTSPKIPDKTLKRKLEDTEARHTRSSTKEGSAAKKR